MCVVERHPLIGIKVPVTVTVALKFDIDLLIFN